MSFDEFKPGDKVICIDAEFPFPTPVLNLIQDKMYTVESHPNMVHVLDEKGDKFLGATSRFRLATPLDFIKQRITEYHLNETNLGKK